MKNQSQSASFDLSLSLLDDPIIRWRDVTSNEPHASSLPDVFAALAADDIRDFPALRTHQRHPWHAFLVQLAVIALHRAGCNEPWTDAASWRNALMALTPDHLDGAAWYLVSPPDKPAFMQPPVPGEDPSGWKPAHTPDAMDMLVTAKNHDLKVARIHHAQPDDWVFSLVSLQTQDGFGGNMNYGISRMNSGSGSRLGVGIAVTNGMPGLRWRDDIKSIMSKREDIAETYGLTKARNGHTLLWLIPWSGKKEESPLEIRDLDPLYIEICRRVRLSILSGQIKGYKSTSEGPRVTGVHKGATGDPWTPVNLPSKKYPNGYSLSIIESGFNYAVMSRILSMNGFQHGAAWRLCDWPSDSSLSITAQVVSRGQGKTKGYHERQLPISPKTRRLLEIGRQSVVGALASKRVEAIESMRSILQDSLVVLFASGKTGNKNDTAKNVAKKFALSFEKAEDARFFDDLTLHVEAQDDQREDVYTTWLVGLASRAEHALRAAFDAGPRNAMQRYKARSEALRYFSAKTARIPELAAHYAAKSRANTADRPVSL